MKSSLMSYSKMHKPDSSNSPSNLAVQDYFTDLTQSKADLKYTHVELAESDYAHKLSEAELLLKKAQSLSLLLDAPSVHSNIQVKSAEITEKQEIPEYKHKLDESASISHQEIAQVAEIEDISGIRNSQISLKEHLDERFQVLLCEVAGLVLALPLVELGGIHTLTKVSPIVGKPPWFMGLLIKGDNTYQCIDTARCIIPERYTKELQASLDYKFAIQLGKSPYVLCCEQISMTMTLDKSDIKWRGESAKRAWSAGVLKDKMCALVDGARMVQVVLGRMH
jgi:chemotaxis signal transduction protein